jgi:hypothetical protein
MTTVVAETSSSASNNSSSNGAAAAAQEQQGTIPTTDGTHLKWVPLTKKPPTPCETELASSRTGSLDLLRYWSVFDRDDKGNIRGMCLACGKKLVASRTFWISHWTSAKCTLQRCTDALVRDEMRLVLKGLAEEFNKQGALRKGGKKTRTEVVVDEDEDERKFMESIRLVTMPPPSFFASKPLSEA